MSAFAIVLIFHVLAVLLMTAVLAIEAISLAHLRGARTTAEALPWINPVPRVSVLAASSILLILLTGGYLAAHEAGSERAWARVAAAAVLLMAPLGALTGKRMRLIRRGFSRQAGETMALLQDSYLKISLGVRVAVFLGVFLLVSTKPGLWGSLTLIGVAILAGMLLSMLGWSRNPSLAAASIGAGK